MFTLKAMVLIPKAGLQIPNTSQAARKKRKEHEEKNKLRHVWKIRWIKCKRLSRIKYLQYLQSTQLIPNSLAPVQIWVKVMLWEQYNSSSYWIGA